MAVNFLEYFSDETYKLLCDTLNVCKKEYMASCSSKIARQSEMPFTIKIVTREKQGRTFDNKAAGYKSVRCYCELNRTPETSKTGDEWGVSYKVRELQRFGVSDSAMFRLFLSLSQEFSNIRIEGICYMDSTLSPVIDSITAERKDS